MSWFSSSPAWTAADAPRHEGRVALVTGANSGIGLEVAQMLAGLGAEVIFACRTESKAREAMARVEAAVPGAKLAFVALDLASLASVRAAAEAVSAGWPRLDLLINNAGLMAIPRALTADGFEMQLGTNHLGHFALTGLLWPALLAAEAPRVVNVSSNAHKMGSLNLDDLMGERGYGKWSAYGQSKLANLLFTFELAQRAPSTLKAVACHPGYSATNLVSVGPQLEGAAFTGRLFEAVTAGVAQSAEMGALPTLRAATDPEARSGDYYGPSGIGELWGPPVQVEPLPKARDAASARALWEASVALTGVDFGGLGAQS